MPAAAAAALLGRGFAFAAAAAAAVRGGGASRDHGALLPRRRSPRHCGARAADEGAGAAEAPALPAPARPSPLTAVLAAGALCPHFTGGETEDQRAQRLAQGYVASLWQGPGEDPAIRPIAGAQRGAGQLLGPVGVTGKVGDTP